jgi:negative regulator of sigma E activity
LSPDGSVKRIVISDGTNEYTHLIANKKVLKGTAAKSVAKQLASDQEWMLLISNYGMALGEPEPVAGRPSWTIELAPVAPGKSHEKIWIDKQSGIILAIKRYHDHGETAIHSRYVQFKPGGTAPDSFFSTEMSDESESVDHGYNPAFSSDPGRLPRTLPLGFQFESADVFVSDGHRVEHFRFTDGLSQLSVFRADRPARFSNNAREESVSYTPGSIQAQDVGHVLNRKMDAGYFTLIGDVSDEGLARIADVLK